MPARGPDASDRANNFGPIRLVLAAAVLYSHSYPAATGSQAGDPLFAATGSLSLGALAVNAFFLISGLLVTQSWERSRGAADFLRKRAARLYPGYLAAIVLTAVAAAAAHPGGPIRYARLCLWMTGDVFTAALFFDNPPGLPPSYLEAPYPNVINASIWTLPSEARCYLLVVGLGAAGWLRRRAVVGGIAIVAYALFAGTAFVASYGAADNTIWRFVTYFAAGAWVAVVGPERLPFGPRACLGSAVGLAVTLAAGKYAQILFPIFGSHLVLAFAYARQMPGAGWFDRHDLSYGTYLYAWPVQQSLAWHAHIRDPLILFWATLPITLALAWVSWTVVEAPVLARVRGARGGGSPPPPVTPSGSAPAPARRHQVA